MYHLLFLIMLCHPAIEQSLAFENYDTVNTLLGSIPAAMCPPHDRDAPTCTQIMDNTANPYADQIVDNYAGFYSLYMKYKGDTMTGDDSTALTALASLCPVQNGAVVYQARALYSLVYNDLAIFSDDSLCDSALVYARKSTGGNSIQQGNTDIVKANVQQYRLYPNPSDGNIIVEQLVTDERAVKARIMNIIGQTLLNDNIYFQQRRKKMNMQSLLPGTYLLELRDSSGRIFNFKFVIGK